MDVIGIGAVMMCPMIALGITLYASWKASEDMGKER
jgi:hypothetical protein